MTHHFLGQLYISNAGSGVFPIKSLWFCCGTVENFLSASKMPGKEEFVKLQVSGNKVVVFSKTYCQFCKKAKTALGDAGLKDYLVIELDQREDGDEIQDALLKIAGSRSVSVKRQI